MTKTIGTKELAVLINRSARTARRYIAKLPNARKVAGKWVVSLTSREVRIIRAKAIDLARQVAKAVRDQQCGTASEDLQEMQDRAVEMLRVVWSPPWLVEIANRMVAKRNPNYLSDYVERKLAA